MKKILQLAWIFSLIIPFLLLDWKWAIIVLVINFIGILPLGILIIGVLKPIFGVGHWVLNFFTGIGEAFLYALLNNYLNPSAKFMLALVSVYLINQIGRVFRTNAIQIDEAITLFGFLCFLGINYLFRWMS